MAWLVLADKLGMLLVLNLLTEVLYLALHLEKHLFIGTLLIQVILLKTIQSLCKLVLSLPKLTQFIFQLSILCLIWLLFRQGLLLLRM